MPIIIEICPHSPHASACTMDGESIRGSEFESDMRDCIASGDVQPACEYIRDHVGVDWRIVARDGRGIYRNREATAAEKQATCEAIYFDSESDFSDESLAETYLIWDAALDLESEE